MESGALLSDKPKWTDPIRSYRSAGNLYVTRETGLVATWTAWTRECDHIQPQTIMTLHHFALEFCLAGSTFKNQWMCCFHVFFNGNKHGFPVKKIHESMILLPNGHSQVMYVGLEAWLRIDTHIYIFPIIPVSQVICTIGTDTAKVFADYELTHR